MLKLVLQMFSRIRLNLFLKRSLPVCNLLDYRRPILKSKLSKHYFQDIACGHTKFLILSSSAQTNGKMSLLFKQDVYASRSQSCHVNEEKQLTSKQRVCLGICVLGNINILTADKRNENIFELKRSYQIAMYKLWMAST